MIEEKTAKIDTGQKLDKERGDNRDRERDWNYQNNHITNNNNNNNNNNNSNLNHSNHTAHVSITFIFFNHLSFTTYNHL